MKLKTLEELKQVAEVRPPVPTENIIGSAMLYCVPFPETSSERSCAQMTE